VTGFALLCLQVFLVIAILMGEGLYMVVKVLYSSESCSLCTNCCA